MAKPTAIQLDIEGVGEVRRPLPAEPGDAYVVLAVRVASCVQEAAQELLEPELRRVVTAAVLRGLHMRLVAQAKDMERRGQHHFVRGILQRAEFVRGIYRWCGDDGREFGPEDDAPSALRKVRNLRAAVADVRPPETEGEVRA